MSGDSDARPSPQLPPGETDPNQLYIAVGRAIHAWESMEEALACLYAAMTGLPEKPDAVSEYGAENKIFRDRIAAVQSAAETYFVSHPDQRREGELSQLLADAVELSIKRHRVAHGHITMWTEFHFPDPLPPRGTQFVVEGTVLYRWGAPWYSMVTLRTDPIGGNAASIDAMHDEFGALHNRIAKFTSELTHA